MLKDKINRHIHKMRLSLLDQCNMRCFYCIPHNREADHKKALSADRLLHIVETIIPLGIDEIRLTGGEPLLHPQFDHVVTTLGRRVNHDLKKLGLTTNGTYLEEHLEFLQKNNCNYINISLDSIDPDTYAQISKTGTLEPVLRSIDKAIELGLKVKLNCVLLKNINDAQIIDLIKYAADRKIQIRFLELMKIGEGVALHDKHFISAPEVIERLKQNFHLSPLITTVDSTSYDFFIPELSASIGFIASESQHFCANCSRLRLDSHGLLRSCLMSNKGEMLRDLSDDEIKEAVQKTIAQKPLARPEQNPCSMNKIGG